MKGFFLALSVAALLPTFLVGFSVQSTKTTSSSNSNTRVLFPPRRLIPLSAHQQNDNSKADLVMSDDDNDDDGENMKAPFFAKSVASFTVAVALLLGTGPNPSFATMTPPSSLSGGDGMMSTSSSILVSAEYTDLTMPSYRSALDSPVNTVLKGTVDPFADGTAFGGASTTTEAPKSVADEATEAERLKQVEADKKAAKAEQKAQRARQKAAADAAAVAAKEQQQ